MKKLNKKGFSLLHTLLLLAVVGVVGFIGWYVWQRTYTQPATSSANQLDEKTALFNGIDRYCKLVYSKDIQKFSGLKLEDIFNPKDPKIKDYKFADWRAVGQNNYASNQSYLYKRVGDFVVISAGCRDDKLAESEEDSSNFEFLVKKHEDGSWFVISVTQEAEYPCVETDGYSIPEGLVKCYDYVDKTNRDPR